MSICCWGEYRNMDPGPLEEFTLFDHPSGRTRITARDKAVTLSTRKARRKRKGEAVSECSMILTRRMTKTTARPLLCSKPRRNPARPISYFAMGGGGTTS
jgi:hypothetical protein